MRGHTKRTSGSSKKKFDGYLAITSVMILLIAAGVFLSYGFLNLINFNDTSSVSRDAVQAHSVANSCAEIAISQLQDDFTFAAGGVYAIGSYTCTITSISGTGNTDRTVEASAQVGLAQVNVQVVIDTIRPNVIISQWQRI